MLYHLAIDMLPEEEREALEEAQSLCPDLVERESNPLCFLRYVYTAIVFACLR